MRTNIGFNPHLLHARQVLKSLCSTKPFAERATEARIALSRIVDHSADLDPEVVGIIKNALDENLTPEELSEALADTLETVFRLVKAILRNPVPYSEFTL
jgi:hypothetical protein